MQTTHAASNLTVGDVARFLGVPSWRVRRAVDSLDLDIPRAGQYRLVPREAVGLIAAELQRRGWLPDASEQQEASG